MRASRMATKVGNLLYGYPKVNLGTCIPTRSLVKMPYYEEFSVASFGAVYADYTFSLTNIFDPNTTGTGHQPRMHDQWALLYSYYRVRKVAIFLQAWNQDNDASAAQPQLIGSCCSSFSGGSSEVTNIIESPYAAGFIKNNYKMINRAGISISNNKYVRRLKINNDSLRNTLYATGAPGASGLELAGQFGAAPAGFNMYFSIYSGSVTGLDNVNIQCSIRLMYEVELMEPIFQTQS